VLGIDDGLKGRAPLIYRLPLEAGSDLNVVKDGLDSYLAPANDDIDNPRNTAYVYSTPNSSDSHHV
jgi:hypothetical protein